MYTGHRCSSLRVVQVIIFSSTPFASPPYQPGQRDGEDRGGEELCVSVGDPVSVLCVDHTTGCIVVGVQNTLKSVYIFSLQCLALRQRKQLPPHFLRIF